MTEVVKIQIKESLQQLRLPAFVANYSQQAALATREGWPYDNYLFSLCQLELNERHQRKINKLLSSSKLPREKTLSAFDRTRLKKNVDMQFAALLAGDFLDRKENVLIFGNPGSGKT